MPFVLLVPLLIGLIGLEFIASMRRAFEMRQKMPLAPEQTIEKFCLSRPENSKFVINISIFKQNQWVNACSQHDSSNQFRRWQIELAVDLGDLGGFRILKMHYLR
jgi:hypothetical protein